MEDVGGLALVLSRLTAVELPFGTFPAVVTGEV